MAYRSPGYHLLFMPTPTFHPRHLQLITSLPSYLYLPSSSSAAHHLTSLLPIPSYLLHVQCDFPMSRTGASLKTEKPLSIGPQRLHPSSPSVPMIFPQTSESTLPVSDTVTPFTATPAFMPSPRHPGSNRLATGGNLTSGLARTMLPHIPQDLNFDSSRSLSTRVELVSPMYDVLVVDDSSLNRKMLRKIFLSSGCDCDDAYDGLCAIEKVKERMNRTEGKKSYDAILMDFVMPNMNGPTSTEEIRKLGYKGLIFGVTGNYLDSDVTYFLRKGADAVLSKPFDPIIFHKLMKEKFVNESI